MSSSSGTFVGSPLGYEVTQSFHPPQAEIQAAQDHMAKVALMGTTFDSTAVHNARHEMCLRPVSSAYPDFPPEASNPHLTDPEARQQPQGFIYPTLQKTDITEVMGDEKYVHGVPHYSKPFLNAEPVFASTPLMLAPHTPWSSQILAESVPVQPAPLTHKAVEFGINSVTQNGVSIKESFANLDESSPLHYAPVANVAPLTNPETQVMVMSKELPVASTISPSIPVRSAYRVAASTVPAGEYKEDPAPTTSSDTCNEQGCHSPVLASRSERECDPANVMEILPCARLTFQGTMKNLYEGNTNVIGAFTKHNRPYFWAIILLISGLIFMVLSRSRLAPHTATVGLLGWLVWLSLHPTSDSNGEWIRGLMIAVAVFAYHMIRS